MSGIFGITGRQQVEMPDSLLSESWCGIRGFEDTFQTDRYFFFATGNTQFKEKFDARSFFQALKKSPELALTNLPGLSCGAIWDVDSRELIVYTDPFSVFPIYYAHDAYKAVFADSLPMPATMDTHIAVQIFGVARPIFRLDMCR